MCCMCSISNKNDMYITMLTFDCAIEIYQTRVSKCYKNALSNVESNKCGRCYSADVCVCIIFRFEVHMTIANWNKKYGKTDTTAQTAARQSVCTAWENGIAKQMGATKKENERKKLNKSRKRVKQTAEIKLNWFSLLVRSLTIICAILC